MTRQLLLTAGSIQGLPQEEARGDITSICGLLPQDHLVPKGDARRKSPCRKGLMARPGMPWHLNWSG